LTASSKPLMLNPMAAQIELKSVDKVYRVGDEQLHALDGVNVTIQAGDFVAITGPSGSGKSTLANIIGGLDRPNKGSVVVDGVDLSRAGDRQLSHYRNKTIGFVFQAFNLQPALTALENVMVPLLLARQDKQARQDRAAQCLRDMGLGDRMHHRPTQLSGGQRQRVSIARALANQPQIIIADEPTGNLDSARGKEILELLRSLNRKGTTLLVITHDMDIAGHAKRVLAIRDGKVSEGRR
jgi:putative ABC transport system ATP-binding protein